MSKLNKTINQHRIGDDWRENFKYLNYTNVEASLKAILTATEPKKVYDRLGNLSGTGMNRNAPISLDETIFRIASLMESQLKDFDSRPRQAVPGTEKVYHNTDCEVDGCPIHTPKESIGGAE